METDFLPFVSIIVLNYNQKSYLSKCLSSLKQLNYPRDKFEVILVDNCSTDGSVEYVKNIAPWVRVLRFRRNYGFAGGNNRAVKFSKGEYIAFLNPDTEVDKDWLLELVKGMRKHPDVASCGGKVLFLKERDVIQNAGHKMTWIGIPCAIGYREEDAGQYEEPRYTLAASGCAMLVRKDIFEKLGGFDEDYFLYVEEGDFGLRLWLSGYKVAYFPKAIAYHESGAMKKSRGKPIPEHVFFYQKNIISTIIKNFELANVLKGFCLLFLYDISKIIYFVKTRNIRCVLALLKGLKYAIKELPKNLTKRRKIQNSRKITDRELYNLGLIMPVNQSIHEFIDNVRLSHI